jgi:FG-GAP repeat
MGFLAVAALSACAGFSRSQASDTAEFTTKVVPASGAPDALAVADVNHDGVPDILAANPEAGTITVLLGDRTFHEGSRVAVPGRTSAERCRRGLLSRHRVAYGS